MLWGTKLVMPREDTYGLSPIDIRLCIFNHHGKQSKLHFTAGYFAGN